MNLFNRVGPVHFPRGMLLGGVLVAALAGALGLAMVARDARLGARAFVLSGGRAGVTGAALEGPAKGQTDVAALTAGGAGQRGELASVAGAGAAALPSAVGAPAVPGAPAAQGGALPPIGRMVVKTGALTLQITHGGGGDPLAAAMQRVNAVVAGIPGAYVAASSTSYRADTPLATGGGAVGVAPREPVPQQPLPKPLPTPPAVTATLSLRVPADAFDLAMQRMREIGSPLAEQVATQEVTEEYVDLEAQVRNLEATEQQYLRFLERAQRLEEILPIQQRLSEVRGQIERLRGRMTLLQRRSDVSTISLTLVVPASKADAADEPRAVRTLRAAWRQLAVALQALLDVLIYVGVYALPLIPIGVAYAWWRRRRSPAAAAGGVV